MCAQFWHSKIIPRDNCVWLHTGQSCQYPAISIKIKCGEKGKANACQVPQPTCYFHGRWGTWLGKCKCLFISTWNVQKFHVQQLRMWFFKGKDTCMQKIRKRLRHVPGSLSATTCIWKITTKTPGKDMCCALNQCNVCNFFVRKIWKRQRHSVLQPRQEEEQDSSNHHLVALQCTSTYQPPHYVMLHYIMLCYTNHSKSDYITLHVWYYRVEITFITLANPAWL